MIAEIKKLGNRIVHTKQLKLDQLLAVIDTLPELEVAVLHFWIQDGRRYATVLLSDGDIVSAEAGYGHRGTGLGWARPKFLAAWGDWREQQKLFELPRSL